MRGVLREMGRALRLGWHRTRIAMVLAVVVAALGATSTAASAAIQRALIDGAEQGSPHQIMLIALGAGAVFTIWLALARIGGPLWDQVVHRVVPELRAEVLDLIDRRSSFEDIGDPDFLDDLERVRRESAGPIHLPWLLFSNLMGLAGLGLSIWLLLAVDWRLLVILAGVLLSLVLSLVAARTEVRETERLTPLERSERHLHQVCIEPRGVEEIRSYDCGPVLSDAAGELWTEIADRRLRIKMRALRWPAAGWLGLGVALVVGLLIVADGITAGRHTTGDLVLVIVLTIGLRGQLSLAIAQANEIGPFVSTVRATARIRDRAGRSSRPMPRDGDLRQGLRLEDVGFTYARSSRPTLTAIDLDLPRGALIAVVGENGAGKTTLANLLLGLLEPTRGRLLVDGVEVEPVAWRQRTSGAFQDFMKPRFTVREAVGIGDPARIDERDAIEAAIAVGNAGDFVASLPDGIDTSLAPRRGTDLSHGQWQLIALARSRMRQEPLLLVLDEPTSALDAHAEFELFQSFAVTARQAAVARGTISVMISHRYSAAYLADRILVVDEGQIIEQGTHAELMALNGRYREMFELQRIAYLG
ncbi:ATP-binding cassette domain-containing protein [Tessaracoccus caeni]|uniref:ATP-binding cassette domain-containing protein n=1 Tax=Tessaracoccus caeni TaxID=3031239 RepID=UPI0023D9FC7B|nr:ABC transporter ATP-binding protein [Tessaracoccus caeni]MDF1489032.1 ABC transporter ATP-binding protein [Tessaracoccus caeni]